MTDDRRRELATNLERIAVNRDVNVVKPRYSEVVTNNVKNLYRSRNQPQADRQNHRASETYQSSKPIIHQTENYAAPYNRTQSSLSRQENPGRYTEMRPQRSMKMIALKFYNHCRGKAAPRDEILEPGACFCCGDKNHRRTDCPLRNRCLICGKEGHVFKDCHLAKPPKMNHLRDILCIHDEEQNEDSLNDAYHDVSENESGKNLYQLPVPISSVGLSQ